ncbi:MAG: C39 family peptidase [Deltaproteobacteria bacterium]|jgi:hypothetical protein|nr:C39 family peptidase [Deltaproteobacteria bacterium]
MPKNTLLAEKALGSWIGALTGSLILICALLAGCVSLLGAQPQAKSFATPLDSRLIPEVPFIPDDSNNCGPSALASVLTFHGRPTTKEEVAEEVQRRSLKGSLGPDLTIWARKHGFTAGFKSSKPEELIELIVNQKPVILLLDVGIGAIRKGHFVTALGYGPHGLVVNSGLIQQQIMPWSKFLTQWYKSGNFALIIDPPKSGKDKPINEKAPKESKVSNQKKASNEPLEFIGSGINPFSYRGLDPGEAASEAQRMFEENFQKVSSDSSKAPSAVAPFTVPTAVPPAGPVFGSPYPQPSHLERADIDLPVPVSQSPVIDFTSLAPISGTVKEAVEVNKDLKELQGLDLEVKEEIDLTNNNSQKITEQTLVSPVLPPVLLPEKREKGPASSETTAKGASEESIVIPTPEPTPVMGWER